MDLTTHIPSVEQESILRTYASGTTTSVKYIDLHMAIETMMHSLRDHIGTQKIAIVCSNKEKRDKILAALQSQKMSSFVYFPQSFSPIDEHCINYMRSLEKVSLNLDTIALRSDKQQSYDKLIKRIEASYQGILNPIYKDWNLAEVIYIINSNNLNEKKNILPLEPTVLNPDSYSAIKATIKNAQSIYEPMYLIIDDAGKLRIQNDADTDIKSMIESHLVQLRELRRDYLNKKNSIVENLASESTQLGNTVQALGSSILSKAKTLTSQTSNTKSGYLSNLFSSKSKRNPIADFGREFIDALPQEITASVQMTIPSIESIDDLETFIHGYESEVRRVFSSDSIQQGKTLTRISKLNSEDDAIMSLDHRFTALVAEINTSGIYATKFENNTFSFLKQLDYLEGMIKNISTCHTIVHYYPQYMEWNSVVSSLDPQAQEVISMLYEYPKEQWMDVYEQSFLNNLVIYELQKDAVCNMESSEAALDHLHSIHSSTYDQVLYDRSKKREDAIVSIKGKKKSVYQTIFRKKLPTTITYVELNQQGSEIVDAYFPIHIYTDVLGGFGGYDKVYNFNEEIGSINGALNFSKFEEMDFKAINHESCFPLFLNQYVYTEPISRLSNYEKIRAAKKLAKFLLYITQDIRIYQLKHANIISTIPSYDTSSLHMILEDKGAKAIDTDDLYDNLTECILETGRTQYIITKDGIISPKSETKVLWQQEILGRYVEAGFQNLNVWSADLYRNPQHLEHILDCIVGNNVETSDSEDLATANTEAS